MKYLAAAMMLSALASPSVAQEKSAPAVLSTAGLAQDYCAAFAQEARQAQSNRAKADLETIKSEIDGKLKEVSEKTKQLEDWIKRRNEMLSSANDAILKIYKAMDPSAAAQEISKLDDATASAILQKIDSKKASAILVEMEPKRAASLIALIAAESSIKQEHKS